MESIEDTINIFKETPHENLIISIDIKNNELLTNNPNIKMEDIILLINEVKPDYTILLNISQVGTKEGNENISFYSEYNFISFSISFFLFFSKSKALKRNLIYSIFY